MVAQNCQLHVFLFWVQYPLQLWVALCALKNNIPIVRYNTVDAVLFSVLGYSINVLFFKEIQKIKSAFEMFPSIDF